jgi:hypothetical protein
MIDALESVLPVRNSEFPVYCGRYPNRTLYYSFTVLTDKDQASCQRANPRVVCFVPRSPKSMAWFMANPPALDKLLVFQHNIKTHVRPASLCQSW